MHEGFSVDDQGLRKAWLATWNGMVFVNLSRQAPEPLDDALERVDLSEYDIAHTKVVRDTTHVVTELEGLLGERLGVLPLRHQPPRAEERRGADPSGAQPSHIEAGEFDFRPDYPILPDQQRTASMVG